MPHKDKSATNQHLQPKITINLCHTSH